MTKAGAPKRKSQPRPDNAEQSKRFIDAAKAAGVDESGQEFARAFAKLVKAKPVKTAPN